jgi:hypothetical protein
VAWKKLMNALERARQIAKEGTKQPAVISGGGNALERARNIASQVAGEDTDNSWNITKGLKSGVLSTLAVAPAVGSMAAKSVGMDKSAKKMAEAAGSLMEKASQYQPDTTFRELIKDPSFGGAADWAMYMLGNVAPSMVAGGVGAGAGKALFTKAFLKKAISKNVAKGLPLKAATEQAIGEVAKKGAMTGLVGATGAMEGGHMYLTDIEKHGVKDAKVLPHIIGGAAAGLIELGLGGVEIGLINKFFGKAGVKAAKESDDAAASMLGKIWKYTKTPAGEAGQELAQEEIAMLDEMFVAAPGEKTDTPWSEEGLLRGAESAAAGLLPGAIGGAVSGIMGTQSQTPQDVIDSVRNKLEDPASKVNLDMVKAMVIDPQLEGQDEIVAGLQEIITAEEKKLKPKEVKKPDETKVVLPPVEAGKEKPEKKSQSDKQAEVDKIWAAIQIAEGMENLPPETVSLLKKAQELTLKGEEIYNARKQQKAEAIRKAGTKRPVSYTEPVDEMRVTREKLRDKLITSTKERKLIDRAKKTEEYNFAKAQLKQIGRGNLLVSGQERDIYRNLVDAYDAKRKGKEEAKQDTTETFLDRLKGKKPTVRRMASEDIKTQIATNEIKLYSIDNVKPDPSKPHGAYYNIEYEGFESPHKKDYPKGTEYRKKASPNNPFFVGKTSLMDSAGMSALHKMLGAKEVNRLRTLGGINEKTPITTGRGSLTGKKALIAELSKKYPNIKWEEYYDSREMLEGLAGVVVREKGHDAIIQVDNQDFAMSEYVDLSKPPTSVKQKLQTQPEAIILKDTTQALEFGKQATPEQITELKRLRQESVDKTVQLKKDGKLQEAMDEITKGQLYREALESAEEVTKPLTDKQKKQSNIASDKDIKFETKDNYKGSHTAPEEEVGASLDNLTNIFPDDIYGSHGARYYGHGGDSKVMDQQTITKIRSFRGKPDAKVIIYRAIPKSKTIPAKINSGDWVTINKQYAISHGKSYLKSYQVIQKTVKASELFTDGNSIHEWGYAPEGTKFEIKANKAGGLHGLKATDIRKAFAKTKAMTGTDKKGRFWFKFKGMPKITVIETNSVAGELTLQKGADTITGAYVPGKQILFKTSGKGVTADIGSLYHENWHLFKDMNVLTGKDLVALHQAIRKAGHKGKITEETEAGFIGDAMINRTQHADTMLDKVLQKVADFFDAIAHLFGKRSMRGLLRDIESGKITEQKQNKDAGLSGKGLPLFQMTGQKAIRYETDNPDFRKWFKNSKVVDENGEPLIVYHGGPEFNIFDPTKIGKTGRTEGAGFYFTPNIKIAKGYAGEAENGELKEVYLNISKPINYEQPGFKPPIIKKIITALASLELKESGISIRNGFLSNYGDISFEGKATVINSAARSIADEFLAIDQMGGLVGAGVDPVLVNKAFQMVTGHDGIKAKGFSGKGGSDIWVAFSPTQIKSIYNTGAFDPANPDIRYETKKDPQAQQASAFVKEELKKAGIKTAFKKLNQTPKDEFKSIREEKGELLKNFIARFGINRVPSSDMKWHHRAFEAPSMLARRYKSMKEALDTGINAQEARIKTTNTIYNTIPVHSSMSLQGAQEAIGKDKKANAELTKLVWDWDGKKFPEEQVPTNFFKSIKSDKSLQIQSEHYREAAAFLKSEGVSQKAIDAFIAMRVAYDKGLIETHNKLLIEEWVDRDDIEEFRSVIGKTHNYFPHKRYGDTAISIRDKATNELIYNAHYNDFKERFLPVNKQAHARAAQWLKKNKDNPNDYIIQKPYKITKIPDQVFHQVDLSAMQQILDVASKKMVEAENSEATQAIRDNVKKEMKDLMAKSISDVIKSRAWAGHAIGRKNIPGYETDDIWGTTFDYFTGWAGFMTKMDAAKQYSEVLQKIDAKKNPNEYRYVSIYIRDMLTNKNAVDRAVDFIRGLFFVKYLGFVIKSGLVNLTQNFVLAAPVMSLYTKGSTFKLTKAMIDTRRAVNTGAAWSGKDVYYGKHVKGIEAKALNQLVEEGTAQDQMLRELKGTIPAHGAMKLARKVIDKSGVFMQIAEKFNRTSTGLAAFRVAYNEGLTHEGIKTKGNYEASVAFAKKIIYDAHFLYGDLNLPSGFRGGDFRKVIRAGYTFRTFTHQYLGIINHMFWNQKGGKAAVARSMRNLIILGGLTAVPFFKALSETLAKFTDDDDEDTLTRIREKMPNQWMKNFAVYGLAGLGGADITGSISIEVPRSFTDILGVPYAAIEDTINTSKSIKSGAYKRAFAESPFTPAVVRNAMRGIELHTVGQRTRSGKDINYPGKAGAKKITKWEAIRKGLAGIQPPSLSSGYKAYYASGKMKRNIAERKRAWADRYVNAVRRGDEKERYKIVREIVEWNSAAIEDNKTWRLVNIEQMIKSRMAASSLRGIPKTQRPRALEISQAWQ